MQKFIQRLLLTLGLVVGSSLNAQTVFTNYLFPTGVNASGQLLGAGSADPHYSSPQGTIIESANGSWITSPLAGWIGPTASGGSGANSVNAGVYDYSTTFNMPANASLSNITLTATMAADDGLGLYVNGQYTGDWFISGYAQFKTFAVSNYFVPGANTVTFAVTNAGTGLSPSGLLVTNIYITYLTNGLPGIATGPLNQYFVVSNSTSFTVSVYGSLPWFYQWQQNGVNLTNGGNVSGSSSSNLVLDPTIVNNAGNYTVIVSNTSGSITSSVASLTELPTNLIVWPGSSVTFSVPASNLFEWQFDGAPITNSIINTVAGNGTNGYFGDNGSATNAELADPIGAAIDSLGNLFIADTDNQRIRKIDTNRVITTVAGNGTAGYGGDGSAATNAELNYPVGMAIDKFGNLFIADFYNQRIRKLSTNGIVTTVAGVGDPGFSGDGGAATNTKLYYPYGVAVDGSGNLFIADTDNQRVRKVGTNGIITTVAGNGTEGYFGDGGAATNAELNYPTGVAVDSFGNLFIVDNGNQCIRKVNTNGIITTAAGNGTVGYFGDGGLGTNAELDNPFGEAVDGFGNLFIADENNARVRKLSSSGVITTVAGNGTAGYSGDGGMATGAELRNPIGVAVDSVGNLFVADLYNNRIRKVSFGIVSPPSLILNSPSTLTINFATTNDTGNYAVVFTNASGSVTDNVTTLNVESPTIQPTNQIVWAGGNATFSIPPFSGPLAYKWQFNNGSLPNNAIASASSIILANVTTNDSGTYSVFLTNVYGTAGGVAVLTVEALTTFLQPTSLAIITSNNISLSAGVTGPGPFYYYWLLNGTNINSSGYIKTVAGNGTDGYSGDYGVAINAELSTPENVLVETNGYFFIADLGNYRVREVADGIISTAIGNGTPADLYGPWGLAVNSIGSLYVSDSGNDRILIGNSTVAGNETRGYSGDGGAATKAELNGPVGVAVDGLGDLFIADSGNDRVRMVNNLGIITTVVGNGTNGFFGDGGAATNAQLNGPTGLAVDSRGDLFIADTGNGRIRELYTNGDITTVAGNGISGYSGDGGVATNASLNNPIGVALDNFGDLFIADSGNNRIREVYTNDNIETVAGNGMWGYFGDNGPATAAELYEPTGVAVDSTGDVFIADASNNRIREVLEPHTTPNLVLYNVSTNQNGYYSVIVSNQFGSVTSAPIAVAVYDYPVIISLEPTNYLDTALGATETLGVTATGTALNYQWYDATGAMIPGATNTTLMIPIITEADSGYITVKVSNAVGTVDGDIYVSVDLAARRLPTGYWQGIGYWPDVPMTYTIKVGPPAGTIVYAVQDQLTNYPSAFTNSLYINSIVGNIDDGGTFDANNYIFKWGPFFDSSSRTLTYVLTPPPGTTNWAIFSGIISIDGTNYPVAGPNEINLLPLHPADNGGNGSQPIDDIISISEMAAYASAWRAGSTWPVEPNPIPIAYMTQAGLIWAQGEYYVYNPNAGNPPNCWVNTNPPPNVLQTLLASNPTNSPSTVVSSMPAIYTNLVPFTVSLTVTPATNTLAYAVEDEVPSGWLVTNISSTGVYSSFDSYNNAVKWGPIFSSASTVLTYQVIPPASAAGAAAFAGVGSFNGANIPITGIRQVYSGSTPPAFQNASLSKAGLVLTWSAVPTLDYQLQYSTNLASTNWINVGGALTGTHSTLSVTNAIGPNPRGFYRVLQTQ